MFTTVFSFELRQHLKKPFTWIFFLLMLVQGVYYMHHSGEFFSADKTYANAPAIIYTVLAGIGYIGFIATAILAGAALGKDLDYRTTSLLYTTRAKERSFLLGRYSGSLIILLLLFTGYLAGILLYNYLPVPNLGPFDGGALVKGLLLIFLPNVFILYTLSFTAAVLTKNARSAYAVALMGMLLMIFAETSFEHSAGVVVADPTAFSVLHSQLLHLSPAEKNAFSPEFSGFLLYNRLLWVLISIATLLVTLRTFSFAGFSAAVQRKNKKKRKNETATGNVQRLNRGTVKPARQYFSLASDWSRAFSLSWLEFKNVTRTTGFRLFLGFILVIYVCYIAVWQQEYYASAPTLPVTIEITGVTLPLSFYFLLFLIINTGELLFKDQTSGFWKIGDALPVPSWTVVLSRILAMLGVAVLLSVFLMLLGILVQTFKGYFYFEPLVYFNDLFVRWIPKYLAYILLTVFVAGITARRYATHWICILVLVISTVLHELEVIEQHRFNFVFSPGSGMNTDMNGLGIFNPAHAQYMFYWVCLALALLGVGLQAWQRGIPENLWRRISGNTKGRPVFLIIFILGISSFLISGRQIYQTVNVQNKFQTHDDEHAEQALYEKKYRHYRNTPQPKIERLQLNLDLFPEARELEYDATLSLYNDSSHPIDTLHVEWMEFSAIDSLVLKGHQLTLVKQDPELRHHIYVLDTPVIPGERLICYALGHLKYEGYTNGDPQEALTFNGTFLSQDILPFFGYDERRELTSNKDRAAHGLERLPSRLPAADDSVAAYRLFASSQARRIPFELNISTEKDQTAIAPGVLEKTWESGQRRCFRYVSGIPALFDFHILSARYDTISATVNTNDRPVDISLYFHPEHRYNAKTTLASSSEALNFLENILGPYPYEDLRIAERPRYDEELHAYHNMAVLPENHGWIADIRRDEDLDYLRYITTRLIAEQYMRQANISYTLGFPVITTSIPGYLALLQLEKVYGESTLKNRMLKDHDRYLKGRAAEPNSEPALLQCDNQSVYVAEQKGSYTLYYLNRLLGKAVINKTITDFLHRVSVSPDPVNPRLFFELLLQNTPAEYRETVTEVFESDRDIFPLLKKGLQIN